MPEPWARLVSEWTAAGVIDESAAARIRTFEMARAGHARWRWPMWLALAFGGVMLGAGVLLFVAAHWDDLSPAARVVILVAATAVFHVGAAFVGRSQPALASTLHAVGTVALGGGIFLAGQIFNLAEHWPGGILLWAAGAVAAWLLLRDWPQLVLVSLLVPLWCASEWIVASEGASVTSARVLACGLLLLALTYFTALVSHQANVTRRVLHVIGALSFVPAAVTLAVAPLATGGRAGAEPSLSALVEVLGWTVALGAPLGLAALLRGRDAWPNVVAALWILGTIALSSTSSTLPLYPWWALGGAGLVAWGVRDGFGDRVNMGAAVFSITIVAFYFSEVMSKLGRSASLVGLGLVFLAGGWALERARRHFVRQAQEDRA